MKTNCSSRLFYWLLVGHLLCVCPAQVFGSFMEVDSWNLASGVTDRSGTFPVDDFTDFYVVQNPFEGPSALAQNSIGLNTANTQYSFFWSDELGQFNLDTVQHVQTLEVSTRSSGRIFLTPDIDLHLNIDALLHYTSSPADLADIRLTATVYDVTNDDTLYAQAKRGGTLTLQPASGTLAFFGSVVLEAGNQYQLSYGAQADNLPEPSPVAPIDTNGYIHMTLTPVPEPASLALLSAGILLSRRRR